MRSRLVALTLISAFALSACGVKGDLETAPPMWGDKSKSEQSNKKTDDSKSD